MEEELHYLELVELGRRLSRRDVSPVEVTTGMLERIERLEPRLNAYARVTADLALAQARQAETELLEGHSRGPLHGVPIAVKDIFWTQGVPTAAGMAIHRDFVSDEDATVIARLREAGAVLLGKTNLTEGVYAEHRPPFGAPINPWHEAFWPGASSSGSGVAVAAGLCFGALGSETGGSIRLPSAANGVTGLKPTWGRVSRHGVFELAATLDHVGPMARSAADAAALLGVIAGPDPRDPTASQAAVPDYLGRLPGELSGVRVGVDPDWMAGNVDGATLAAFDAAVAVLGDLGCEIRDVRVPDVSDMIMDWFPVCAVQTAVAHADTFPARRDEYGPALAELLDLGRALSGAEYQALIVRRAEFTGRMNALLETIDVLAMPVLSFPTPSLERMTNIDDALIAGLHQFTCPFNLSGHPGIVLPCGVTDDATPIVFQLCGRHFDEALLVCAGHAFQTATSWHARHPAL